MAIITTTDLNTFLGGQTDATDADNLTFAVDAANVAVVEWCGRTFDKVSTSDASSRSYHVNYRYPTRYPEQLDIEDTWETSVFELATDNDGDGTFETTWTLDTDFYLEPLNGLLYGQTRPYDRIVTTGTKTFPYCSRRPAVQVTAAWGWADVPAPVVDATLIKAARLFRRKDSADGVLGFGDGVVRVSTREDPDVVALLTPFQHSRQALLVG